MKSVKNWQNYGRESVAPCFWPTLYIRLLPFSGQRRCCGPRTRSDAVSLQVLCSETLFSIVVNLSSTINGTQSAPQSASPTWRKAPLIRVGGEYEHGQLSYLRLFRIPSPTHSFIPDLKPSFSANPSHCSPSFFFFRTNYMDSPEHICFVLSFSVLHFLVD